MPFIWHRLFAAWEICLIKAGFGFISRTGTKRFSGGCANGASTLNHFSCYWPCHTGPCRSSLLIMHTPTLWAFDTTVGCIAVRVASHHLSQLLSWHLLGCSLPVTEVAKISMITSSSSQSSLQKRSTLPFATTVFVQFSLGNSNNSATLLLFLMQLILHPHLSLQSKNQSLPPENFQK